MRPLVYNIDFEIVGFLFAILLLIETSICYPRSMKKNRIFRLMAALVIVTQGFDIASAFSITYADKIPVTVNKLINSGYFMFGLALCFVFQYYIERAVIPDTGKSFFLKLNKIILIIVESSVVINFFTGFFFDFSEKGEYLHGPLFIAMHIISLWFILCASISLIRNRNQLNKSQLVSSISFVTLYIVSVVVQAFVWQDTLIIMPTVTAMLIIAVFSMETPDFVQLQLTLQELTETKHELEKANEKHFNLAYTDIMTGLSNRAAYNKHLEKLESVSNDDHLIFMMADVNNLKKLNDNLGHVIGDDAIIKAAKLISKHFSGSCGCYRIGGDEFAVISDRLSEMDFSVLYLSFTTELSIISANAEYPFSIAYGYQSCAGMTVHDALKKADEKMYANKADVKSTQKN